MEYGTEASTLSVSTNDFRAVSISMKLTQVERYSRYLS